MNRDQLLKIIVSCTNPESGEMNPENIILEFREEVDRVLNFVSALYAFGYEIRHREG